MKKYLIGTSVRLKGLVAAAEQNGKEGTVDGYQRERYRVKLVGVKQMLAVKEENLEEANAFAGYVPRRVEKAGPTGLGEEGDCPICLEPLVSEAVDYKNELSFRFSCCGGLSCAKCSVPSVQKKVGDLCPLCRQPISKTEEEDLLNTLRHAKREGRPALGLLLTLTLTLNLGPALTSAYATSKVRESSRTTSWPTNGS